MCCRLDTRSTRSLSAYTTVLRSLYLYHSRHIHMRLACHPDRHTYTYIRHPFSERALLQVVNHGISLSSCRSFFWGGENTRHIHAEPSPPRSALDEQTKAGAASGKKARPRALSQPAGVTTCHYLRIRTERCRMQCRPTGATNRVAQIFSLCCIYIHVYRRCMVYPFRLRILSQSVIHALRVDTSW